MCVYVYIIVYIHIHIYVYVYIYMHTYIYMNRDNIRYICMYVYVCIHIYIRLRYDKDNTVLCSPIFTVNPQSIEDLAKRNKETINFDRKSF